MSALPSSNRSCGKTAWVFECLFFGRSSFSAGAVLNGATCRLLLGSVRMVVVRREDGLDTPVFLTLLDLRPRLLCSRNWSSENIWVAPPSFSPVWFSSEAGTKLLMDSMLSSLWKWHLREPMWFICLSVFFLLRRWPAGEGACTVSEKARETFGVCFACSSLSNEDANKGGNMVASKERGDLLERSMVVWWWKGRLLSWKFVCHGCVAIVILYRSLWQSWFYTGHCRILNRCYQIKIIVKLETRLPLPILCRNFLQLNFLNMYAYYTGWTSLSENMETIFNIHTYICMAGKELSNDILTNKK